MLNTQCLNSYRIYKCITLYLNISFNKGLVTQASSRTRQSTHRSYSFEFSNSNSTTVTKQHSKVENSKILYRNLHNVGGNQIFDGCRRSSATIENLHNGHNGYRKPSATVKIRKQMRKLKQNTSVFGARGASAGTPNSPVQKP